MSFLRGTLVFLQAYHLRLFWAELMFMVWLPRRKKYPLRLLVWLPYLILPIAFNNAFDSEFFRVGGYTWSFMAWFAYSIFAVVFCHKTDIGNYIYVFVSAYAIQNLFADFSYFMLYAWFPDAGILYYFISLLLMIALYAAVFILLVRPWVKKLKIGLTVNKVFMLALSALILLVLNVVSSFMVNYNESNAVLAEICLLFGICTFLILMLLLNVYDKSYIQYEKDTMDRMLYEQDRQSNLSKQTIDMINMKCHDIKHQLVQLRAGGEAISDSFYQKTVDSISIYDSYFNTGNQYLDLVLTEKNLLCKNNNICFTCIADGAALNFMNAGDVYSFFGNAIDNAVECVMNYDENKRDISINVKTAAGLVIITVDNYCGRDVEFSDGLPVTIKEDKNNHGFGTRSMRYIVQDLYGGSLIMKKEGNTFSVIAGIPAESKRKEADG